MQILRFERRAMLGLAMAAAASTALFLAGCGSSETGNTSTSMSTSGINTPHIAAAGPAVIDPLEFEQIALDSPVRRVKDAHGLEFLHFKYTDSDGKVYACILPAAMAQGQKKPVEWLSTFAIYRESEVVAQKKIKTATPQAIGDFPFISPKPQEVKTAPTPKPRTTVAVPPMPTMPASPGVSSPMPGSRMPSPMPGAPGAPARQSPDPRVPFPPQ